MSAETERIVFDAAAGKGPCLVIFAGLHGDEKGGVAALERVGHGLAGLKLRGRVVGVRGNLAALAANRRHITRDLNRDWWDDSIRDLRARPESGDSAEDREQRALLEIISGLEKETRTPVVFLDLHSTSAEGLPFSCMPDTLTNLRIALELPIPAVLGLEEAINGPLLGWLSDHGYPGVIIEGGPHEDPRTSEILEAAAWVMIASLRIARRDAIPQFDAHWDRLAEVGQGLPRVLEITHRHETRAGDGFKMVEGFEHFRWVQVGELLANDDTGEIEAVRPGRILMPAYRPGTDQGFFIAREVAPILVTILLLLRRMRLDRLCHLLPGAHRHPDNPDMLVISRWVPEPMVNIIRLLGWRRLARDERQTTLRRRRVLYTM